MITKINLVNIHHTQKSHFFLLMVRTFKISLGNFQMYNTVLLPIVTMPHIVSTGLIYFITGSLHQSSFKCTVNYCLQSHLSGLPTYCCFSLHRKAEMLKMSSNSYEVSIPMSRKTNGILETTSKDLKTLTQGAVLSFHNICYRVQVKTGFLLCRKTIEKEVLANIKYVLELLFK